jgi:hypothetical protein
MGNSTTGAAHLLDWIKGARDAKGGTKRLETCLQKTQVVADYDTATLRII